MAKLARAARSDVMMQPQSSASLLTVERISKAFGGVVALDNVSFNVDAGESLAIIGPNGAGKTTCFNVIHGEVAPDGGDVRLSGRSIVGKMPHAIARLRVGRTFQVAATFSSMTVRESVALALAARQGRDDAVVARMLPVASPRILELLTRVHIDDLADVHCATLAYGDAKRLELAITMAIEPRLLLMDEPTAGMSPRSRHDLMSLATSLTREDNVAVLFTEHDMDIVFEFAQRILVLDRGKLIAAGSPAEIRANERVQAVYLGTDEAA